jgi:hypothetical protein
MSARTKIIVGLAVLVAGAVAAGEVNEWLWPVAVGGLVLAGVGAVQIFWRDRGDNTT